MDPRRIGGLGLSTGADVLVQVAGQRTDLAAVVADGTAASSFADANAVLGIAAHDAVLCRRVRHRPA